MHIEIDSLEGGARRARGITVIIDVFRAFTTAAYAFDQGADAIFMIGDGASALQLRASGRADLCVGEDGGKMIEGFDFGNSPYAMSQTNLTGKTLALRTSNGTRGLLAASGAEAIYTGAFATAEATVRRIKAQNPEVITIVPMGAMERRATEDEVCALYHLALLQDLSPDKAALKSLMTSLVPPPNPTLVASGDYHPMDRELALTADVMDFAIRATYEDGLLVARPE